MTLSTPYFFYIVGAYGVTLLALTLFLGMTLYRWKKTTRLLKTVSHET